MILLGTRAGCVRMLYRTCVRDNGRTPSPDTLVQRLGGAGRHPSLSGDWRRGAHVAPGAYRGPTTGQRSDQEVIRAGREGRPGPGGSPHRQRVSERAPTPEQPARRWTGLLCQRASSHVPAPRCRAATVRGWPILTGVGLSSCRRQRILPQERGQRQRKRHGRWRW